MINDKDAFRKYKTIEVRLHSSTIDFVKISNWAKILYAISRAKGLSTVDLGASRRHIIKTREEMMLGLGVLLGNTELPDAMHDYILKRAELFNSKVKEFQPKVEASQVSVSAVGSAGLAVERFNPETQSFEQVPASEYFVLEQLSPEALAALGASSAEIVAAARSESTFGLAPSSMVEIGTFSGSIVTT
jgi:hypothetical protein